MTAPSEALLQQLDGSLSCVSHKLASRFRPLLKSGSRPDLYESITAAVYLMSSASSLPYVSRDARLQSFSSACWSEGNQRTEDMVESGFFYTGHADHVKCFFCDLGLRDWAPGDTPETEHAKFSPLCFFLKCSRGLDWLRGESPRPPNYPASYLRQDHNQLISLLHKEMEKPYARVACALGFSDTLVLLCIARKFIRLRQTYELQSLIAELQKEWDTQILPGMVGKPAFVDKFDLATVLKQFNP